MPKTLRFVVVLTLLAVGAGACSKPLTADSSGIEVYSRSCARCHGAALQGRAPAPQLAGSDAPSASLPKQYFVDSVTLGNNRMPSFSSQLTEVHIDRVVEYIMEQQGR